MYFLLFIGLLTIALSCIMVVNPRYWANGIIRFSEQSYFHWFEVISRLLAGLLFLLYGQQTVYPKLMSGIGYLLLIVSLGLIIVGSNKHRQFAVWSAHKFKSVFRVSGLFSFSFGVFLIYLSFFPQN